MRKYYYKQKWKYIIVVYIYIHVYIACYTRRHFNNIGLINILFAIDQSRYHLKVSGNNILIILNGFVRH